MSNIKKVYLPVLLSNIVTLACVGFSYVAYSKLLSPAEFGLYSIGLALNSFGTLFLERGTRNAIIKQNQFHADDVSLKTSLTFLILLLSIGLIVVLIVSRTLIQQFYPSIESDFTWVALFLSVYWLTAAPTVTPTAFLEKDLRYTLIAWIESFSVILERAAPALLIIFFKLDLYAFVITAVASRVLKLVFLNIYEPSIGLGSSVSIQKAFIVVKESLWIQLGMGSSFMRDNLHMLIIGPLYGKEWVGYYSWGAQLCTLSSQIFVQIFARVSVSITAQMETFQERWKTIKEQVLYLSIITTPLLFAGLMIIPIVNEAFFESKWDNTLVLLPFLFARMIPSISTTPVAALLMVEKDVKYYVKALWYWAFAELGACLICVLLWGRMGLAYSQSVVAWYGVWLICRYLKVSFEEVLRLLLNRSSLIVALFSYLLFKTAGRMFAFSHVQIIAWAFVTILCAYVSERHIIHFFLRQRNTRL